MFIMIQICSVSFIIGIWMDIKLINLREIVTYKCYSNSSGIPCCSRLSLGHLELAENKYANMLVLLAFRNSYLKKKKKNINFWTIRKHVLSWNRTHCTIIFLRDRITICSLSIFYVCPWSNMNKTYFLFSKDTA